MHKSVGSRDVCPIITAILGEIVSVLPRAHRCRAAEGVLRECENRLVNPTQQLSQTLTQLFLLQCPKAIDDRYANRGLVIMLHGDNCTEIYSYAAW
jgi:hypothetical protein